MQTITIKTYSCSTCEYKQDFDPSNAVLMARHFHGVPAGNCPACLTGKNKDKTKRNSQMHKETDFSKKIKTKILEDIDIDALETVSIDASGKEVKRKLTAAEKTALKSQRDQNLVKLQALQDTV